MTKKVQPGDAPVVSMSDITQGNVLDQRTIDEIAAGIFDVAQNTRMSKQASDRLRALATRLQPGYMLAGLVKFADGTHGCAACGVRASGDGSVVHDRSFPHG